MTDQILVFVKDLARETGLLLFDHFRRLDSIEIGEKSPRNIVTEADLSAEKLIRARIGEEFPDDAIIGEELEKKPGRGRVWHVDPLDGTTNFAFGIPHWCVSIGACDEQGELVGVVYDPLRDEMFTALRGQGAHCNGKKLGVSDTRDLDDALLATGFASMRGNDPDHHCLQLFRNVVVDVRGIRRLGSAALDLAYVAAGRIDLFYEEGLSSWDIAAGALIVKEAGGKVLPFRAEDDYLVKGDVIAAPQVLVSEFRSRYLSHL